MIIIRFIKNNGVRSSVIVKADSIDTTIKKLIDNGYGSIVVDY